MTLTRRTCRAAGFAAVAPPGLIDGAHRARPTSATSPRRPQAAQAIGQLERNREITPRVARLQWAQHQSAAAPAANSLADLDVGLIAIELQVTTFEGEQL
jgi:hypothetical protein